MRKLSVYTVALLLPVVLMTACMNKKAEKQEETSPLQAKANEYAEFELKTDLSVLTPKEREMLPLLFEAAKLAEEIFWEQAYGDKNEVLARVKDDDAAEKLVRLNYGPWERLNDNVPFVDGYGKKPAGAQFYPEDMTKEEFEAIEDESKTSLYTLVQRAEDGSLKVVPFNVAYKEKIEKMAALVKKAARLAEDAGLKRYLEERAEALLTNNYYESDVAWMEMKDNGIDFIIGPIENYEDHLYGYKAAFESFILIKDREWSEKLARFVSLLPDLQKGLPCQPEYKSETPGMGSDINAYDAVFYAGDCNAGSKTIAINLPNDEKVRTENGSRKLQLKNSMKAKFDKILLPIAGVLIDESQQKNVKFDAFFENVMFHEVSHGLGMGNTIDGTQTVREALKETYSSVEESKADIVGLWCVTKLYEMGELEEKDLMDNFVTFMAGIFRSIRFGAASAHGKANMMCFNYFKETGAFSKDEEKGVYKVDFEKMKESMLSLSELILTIQGDGNYAKAKSMIEEKGKINEELQKDLDRIASAGIPRDIIFVQGKDVLGL